MVSATLSEEDGAIDIDFVVSVVAAVECPLVVEEEAPAALPSKVVMIGVSPYTTSSSNLYSSSPPC